MAHVGEEVGLGFCGGHGFFFGSEEIRFGLLAIGDVFGCVEEILRISSRVPDDREGTVGDDDAAIAANEMLLPLIAVVFAFEEFPDCCVNLSNGLFWLDPPRSVFRRPACPLISPAPLATTRRLDIARVADPQDQARHGRS